MRLSLSHERFFVDEVYGVGVMDFVYRNRSATGFGTYTFVAILYRGFICEVVVLVSTDVHDGRLWNRL